MSFEANLASYSADIIEQTLFSMLDELVGDPEVLRLREQYNLAENKLAFLSPFRSIDGETPPLQNPQLLSQFAHLTCVQTLVLNLCREKAWHNQMRDAEKESPCHPAVESIARAIEMQKNDGLSIEGAIDILNDMTLQIVGTEHPTDPFSQPARELYTQLAQAMEEMPPSQQRIRTLLSELLKVDMTPSVKRKVPEEVTRNIAICLEPLYDQSFRFRHQILEAFRRSYGEAVYQQHREAILAAIEGGNTAEGRVIPPLLSQASWPGGDSDGNTAVDAEATALGMSQYRIAAAEKHAVALNDTIAELAKKRERELRSEHLRVFTGFKNQVCDQSVLLYPTEWKLKVRQPMDSFLQAVQDGLSDRAFSDILIVYQQCRKFLKATLQEDSMQIVDVLEQQVKHLIALTQFSGMHRERLQREGNVQDDPIQYKKCDGSIQVFQQLLLAYAKQLGTNHKAIYMCDDTGEQVPATRFGLEYLAKLLQEHADILNVYPELREAVEAFRFTFKSFGMTYGQLHIRQNAGVYTKVWDILLRACQHFAQLQGHSIFRHLQEKSYKDLTDDQRSAFHAELNDNSAESMQLRAALYHMFINNIYPDIKAKEESELVRTELQRILLAIENADLVELLIIANTASSADLEQVESLFNLFPLLPHEKLPTIVPLLETPDDLLKYRKILTRHLQHLAQQVLEEAYDRETADRASQPVLMTIFGSREQIAEQVSVEGFGEFLQAYPVLYSILQTVEVEDMFGYSDTQKAWGSAALLLIKKTRELFIQLVQSYGMRPRIFDGPGGDLIRGSTLRNDATATLQGRARELLNTEYGADLYRGSQFYREYTHRAKPATQMEITSLPQAVQETMDDFIEISSRFFMKMHDDKSRYGQLLGALIARTSFWGVGAANVSSRATQRGIDENKGDRTAPVQTGGVGRENYVKMGPQRAISAMEAQEMLREMLDFISSGIGMLYIKKDKTKQLLEVSETFGEIFFKEEIAARIRHLPLIAEVLFDTNPTLNPFLQSDDILQQWALECENSDFACELEPATAEDYLKDSENEGQIRYFLSRYLAWISVCCERVTAFMLELEQELQDEAANSPSAIGESSVSLLSHYPEVEHDVSHMLEVADPLYHIFAQQCQVVSNKMWLDKAYAGLNESAVPQKKNSYFEPLAITNVGRFFGDVASGIMMSQTLPPSVRKMQGNLRRFSVFAQTQRAGISQVAHDQVSANRVNGADEGQRNVVPEAGF